MEGIARQQEFAVAEQVGVREIGREHRIVVMNRRTQQQRLLAVQAQFEMR